MLRFEPWQIVAVPFPYVERPIARRRPTLVVASRLGESHDLLWVLMITSATHRRWPGDIEIDDHISAGLPIPSLVRTAKIATISADVASSLGTLPKVHVAEVRTILRQQLPMA